jgi:hypothetical protein
MVRRALLDVGEDRDSDDALPQGQPPAPQAPRSGALPGATHWRGAGGRWLVWLGRAVVWAVIILVGYRGVFAIIDGSAAGKPTAGGAADTATTAFPETLAEAYALQFGGVYLNFSPATAALRSQQLSRFLPPALAGQLGWNGSGTQRLLSEQVASVSVRGPHAAVVTLLARLGDGRMIELGVPVYAAGGAMSVSGDPALLPAPARAVPPAADLASGDQAAQAELQSQLPAFFAAYASSDRATLARFAWPGTRLTGLNGLVTYHAIDSLYVPSGGARRQIRVTVTWTLPAPHGASGRVATAPASLQTTYQMTVVQQHGSWDVQAIGASAQPQGPP